MSTSDDVELQLNRLGGIDAALALLRRRSAAESNDSYLGRLQLGAVLVGCKIANTDLGCGGIIHADRGTEGRDFRQGNVEDRSVAPSWGPKALILVLGALARGGCSSQARGILLRVAAALGRCTHAAGVTPLLCDLLSDGTASCRHVSRALALGLHESKKCAAITARDEKCVSTLLTLAFPGQNRVQKSTINVATKQGAEKLESIEHCRAVEPFWDDSVRENALSCLGSLAKANDTAAKSIHTGGGLRLLFILAMGEERPVAGERRTSGRRPRTSLPGSLTSCSRADSAWSFHPLSGGGSSRSGRPRTTGPSPPTRQSSKFDREIREPAMSAPVAESIRRRGNRVEGVSTSGDAGRSNGKENRRGAPVGMAFHRTADLAPAHHSTGMAKEDTTVSSPPSQKLDKVASAQDDSHPAPPAESSAPLRPPRVPTVDVPRGSGAAEQSERLAILATAILLACLRNRGPRTPTETVVAAERCEQPALSRQTRTRAIERKIGRRASAAPGRKSAIAETEPIGASPAVMSSASRSWLGVRHKKRHQQDAGTNTVEGASEGKKKKPLRRVRGRHRSLPSRRGRGYSRMATPEGPSDPDVPGGNTPAGDPAELQTPVRDGQSTNLEGVGRHALRHISANKDGGDENRGLSALQRMSRDRRLEGCGTAAAVFSELERLCGAISRAPELLSASNPLHQELGVVILERGIEESSSDEQRKGEENAGRSEQTVAGEGRCPDERTLVAAAASGATVLTSAPKIARKRKQKQKQLLRSVVSGGGTSLRSLCWMLLHRCPDVSEGAAAVLLALCSARHNQPEHDHEDASRNSGTFTTTDRSSNSNSNCTSSSSGSSSGGGQIDDGGTNNATAAVFPWVVLSLIEQGCVPILRMVAGQPASTHSPSPPPGFDGARRGAIRTPLAAYARKAGEAAAKAPTTVDAGPDEKGRKNRHWNETSVSCPLPSNRFCRAQEGNSITSVGNDPAGAGDATCGCGSISRQAAREVLSTVVDEACARHVERLVHAVAASGNRELRANVSLGLVILCTGTGPRHGGQVWRSFVSGGALPAVLGMMRSPTARPASVSFLRAVSALLEGVPAPEDGFASGDLAGVAKEKEGSRKGEGQEGVEDVRGTSKSGEADGDTVVLVRDPLASLSKEEGARGGKAQAQGIKMACPPRDVICAASPVLGRLILDTPQGQLPLLHGRYRTWEELMAHMGAPHTFAETNISYLTEFVLEMLVLATTFKIEAQANGYAHELRRRLEFLVSDRANWHNGLPFERPAKEEASTKAAEALLPDDSDTPSKGNVHVEVGGDEGAPTRAESEKLEALETQGQMGALSSLQDNRLIHARQGMGTSGSDGSGGSGGDTGRRRRAESTVFEILEAAVRCRHAWLCGLVFREASKMMGAGDGEGLPPSPRELTALLALLRHFLSLLWVTDCQRDNQQECSTSVLD